MSSSQAGYRPLRGDCSNFPCVCKTQRPRAGVSCVPQKGQLPGTIIFYLHGLDNASRVNTFVDVQAYGRHFKAGVFSLAGPLQLRVKVRVVLVCFLFWPPLSVCASTNPTGGLLSRSLSLWSYCSMGVGWFLCVFSCHYLTFDNLILVLSATAKADFGV